MAESDPKITREQLIANLEGEAHQKASALKAKFIELIPDYQKQEADVNAAVTAWQKSKDDFIKTLNSEDEKIFSLRERNPFFKIPDAVIQHQFNFTEADPSKIDSIRSRLKELEEQYEHVNKDRYEGYRILSHNLKNAEIDVKKHLFATPEGKQLVMDAFNADLILGHERHGWFIEGAKNGGDSIPKLMYWNSGSPHSFIDALENKGDSHGLNTMISQARELAEIEGKPLAEAMRERLAFSGLTPFQVDLFTKITQEYEKNTHAAYLEALEAEHGIELEKIYLNKTSPKGFAQALKGEGITGFDTIVSQAREVAKEEGTSLTEAMQKHLTSLGIPPDKIEQFTQVTQAYEKDLQSPGHLATYLEELRTANAPKPPVQAPVENEAKTLGSRIKNLSAGVKWGIAAATVAIGATVGYWVWHTKQQKLQQDTSREQPVARA